MGFKGKLRAIGFRAGANGLTLLPPRAPVVRYAVNAAGAAAGFYGLTRWVAVTTLVVYVTVFLTG